MNKIDAVTKIYQNANKCVSCGKSMASESSRDIVLYQDKGNDVFDFCGKCGDCWDNEVNINIEVSE